MILAGDIGGTTTRLALLKMEGKWPPVVVGQTFASHEHTSLDEIVQKFLGEYGGPMKRACFGVAGPVRNRLSRSRSFSEVWETAFTACVADPTRSSDRRRSCASEHWLKCRTE